MKYPQTIDLLKSWISAKDANITDKDSENNQKDQIKIFNQETKNWSWGIDQELYQIEHRESLSTRASVTLWSYRGQDLSGTLLQVLPHGKNPPLWIYGFGFFGRLVGFWAWFGGGVIGLLVGLISMVAGGFVCVPIRLCQRDRVRGIFVLLKMVVMCANHC